MTNQGGRPPIWSDPEAFAKKVDEYFETEKKNATWSGLALYLGFESRKSLNDYEHKEGKGSSTTQVDDFTVFSDTAQTYIEQKVAEILTGEMEDDVYAFAKEYGKEMEPVAADYFSEVKGLSIEPAPFIPFGDHAGGSPDRFIVGEDAGLEIKCPLKQVKQVKYLQLTDQFDLLRFFPEFYWQCESNLLFTGKAKWYFATFYPRMKKDEHKLKVIEIIPVSEHFQMITNALAGAVKEKLELLNLLQ